MRLFQQSSSLLHETPDRLSRLYPGCHPSRNSEFLGTVTGQSCLSPENLPGMNAVVGKSGVSVSPSIHDIGRPCPDFNGVAFLAILFMKSFEWSKGSGRRWYRPALWRSELRTRVVKGTFHYVTHPLHQQVSPTRRGGSSNLRYRECLPPQSF